MMTDTPKTTIYGGPSRAIALLAAWLATGGSLFFSEVLNFTPCMLCWYQRILMYPLAIILTIGMLRRNNELHHYTLPFSVVGIFVSLYHYLLIKTDWFPPPPCLKSVPCTVDYFNILGFINIPFMAFIAFIIITVMIVASQHEPYAEPASAAEINGIRALTAPTAYPVIGIIAGVLVFLVVLAYIV
jgi:disulfide bond formation protein DsbB